MVVFFSLINKLAKVIMQSTFWGLGKARELKECVLEMDNTYDVQRLQLDNKVAIAVTIFIMTICLNGGLANMLKNLHSG